MFGWLRKGRKPVEHGRPSDDSFLDSLRPGPDPVPPGIYAMWLPHPEAPNFVSSGARQLIARAYKAVRGIETLVLADLMRRLGEVDEDCSQVALPDELLTLTVLGPDDQVFLISALQEKGIRFHFHSSATPAYRNLVLSGFVEFLTERRRDAVSTGPRIDAVDLPDAAAWWALMDHAVSELEGNGEPLQAIGKLVCDS